MSVRISIRASFLAAAFCAAASAGAFTLQEASIESIQQGIRSGEVTCKQVVEAYVARAKAYNGVCSRLVTPDGAKIKAALGATRAGAPLKFPTETLAISRHVPDFDKYKGLTPDFGRMEPTISDPSVMQQYGMVVGIPNAGQVNALEAINIRGERSVTCKGKFDAHPSTGPLPKGAPAECEKFRQLPDALEYAAELDKKYGKNFDNKEMPLYCTPMSFKAVYDTMDIRSTGGGDVAYATDFAPKDSTLVARLRASGAIIYAHAHNSEYNGGSGDPGGMAKVERPYIGAGGSRESWGGMTCNPYDTERVTSGSSGGSGASVAANLVVCSICETTGGSCRGPANYHNTALVVPTKGIISFNATIGADPYRDRPGIICRSVKDATTVLDAFRDKKTGTYFDAGDIFTALPRVIESKTPYLNALAPATSKPLAGMRIGIIRELYLKDSPSDAAVSDGVNAQLKVLKDLGAELVETTHPRYPDDPSIANMAYTFNDAIAEIVPFHMPEVFSWKRNGKPEFEVAGWDVTSRKYLVALSTHKAPLPANLDFNRMIGGAPADPEAITGYTFAFDFAKYLTLRGDSKVYDWATLNANAKYYNDVRRAAMKNWENKEMDPRTGSLAYTMKRRDVMRMVMNKVLRQNDIDVFVNPVNLTLQGKIGGATVGGGGGGGGPALGYGAQLGIPEVFVPGGFATEVYDPVFKLSADGTRYQGVEATAPTRLSGLGLPYNVGFWAEPGQESTLIKVASAYETATKHRKAPLAFGPVKGELFEGGQ